MLRQGHLLAVATALVGCYINVAVCASAAPGKISCCSSLRLALGGKVSYPGNVTYETSLLSYWSQQEQEVAPSCIVRPQDSQDVATALRVLSVTIPTADPLGKRRCQFAIRGGGHTPWAGSANIDNGVTIDLSLMRHIVLNPSRTVVSVGPGNKWIDVYSTLDPKNLSVVGGRNADIGVSGLTTGGGMSFFAPRYGFACDNVKNFEVVLAGGKIVNANARVNRDLWFALKGGSNNFGIVTRFDLQTFPQRGIWSGTILNPIETRSTQIQAFVDLNGAADYDPFAALINSYVYSSAQKGLIVANTLAYTKPEAYPVTFTPFTNIQPQVFNGLEISNLSSSVTRLGGFQPASQRQLYVTRTYGNNLDFLNRAFDIFNSSLDAVAGTDGLIYSLIFQTLPAIIPKQSLISGGNPFGLRPSNGPQVLTLIAATWLNKFDDHKVTAAAKEYFTQLDAEAEERNVTNRWLYLNYAASFQDPIKSYGRRNQARLQAISKKYDPQGIFQKNVPGGFKLFK